MTWIDTKEAEGTNEAHHPSPMTWNQKENIASIQRNLLKNKIKISKIFFQQEQVKESQTMSSGGDGRKITGSIG